MKIVLYGRNCAETIKLAVEGIRRNNPGWINETILVDVNSTDGLGEWASIQQDFTYVYFDEDITWGDAFNQVIEGLAISDDILFLKGLFMPLDGCIDRMLEALASDPETFAIGPVSDMLQMAEQKIPWDSYESATEWSRGQTEAKLVQVMKLDGSAILIRGEELKENHPFPIEYKDEDNLMTEFCLKRFLEHKKLYVCINAGIFGLVDMPYLPHVNEKDILEKRMGIHYFSTMGNMALIKFILNERESDEEIRVLEIGCESGGTLFRLKQYMPNAQLYGAELNPAAAKVASVFANVKVDNIEDQILDFGENDFDYILFGDVLEHLRNPLATIEYCKKLLRDGGAIIASIPNFMHYSVMRDLLRGNFTYKEEGLLDRTHIHMFTYNEIVRLFVEQAGYEIEAIQYNDAVVLSEADNEFIRSLVSIGDGAEEFMYRAYQYLVKARKK